MARGREGRDSPQNQLAKEKIGLVERSKFYWNLIQPFINHRKLDDIFI
jgi:hypothetical protein